MNGFFGICSGLALASALLSLLTGREKELSSLISVVIYVISVIYILSGVFTLFKDGGYTVEHFETVIPIRYIMRAAGIALFGAVASSVCDAVGQKGISGAIEIITIIEILCVFLPLGENFAKELLGCLFE